MTSRAIVLLAAFIASVEADTRKAVENVPHFRKEQIRHTERVTSFTFIDLNDDGKPDILTTGDVPAWFQNPNWTRRVISDAASHSAMPVSARTIGWIHS